MIYITGDTHGDFSRFARRYREKLPYQLTENDYVIVCGDFGLLWERNKRFSYNLAWLSALPFRILWVAGNHENYTMIAEYPLEEWNGGKVRQIARDKIILLERGQVFDIEGIRLFAFGGASSHDIQGGILDKASPTYLNDVWKACMNDLPYRVLNESWWAAELPTEEEMQEGRDNLEKAGYQVDYVISHCASNRIQREIERYVNGGDPDDSLYESYEQYEQDVLTDYFEELEDRLQYKRWYFGHYHVDAAVDDKHSVLYHDILPIGCPDEREEI